MNQPDIRNARFNDRIFILPDSFRVDEDEHAPSRIDVLVYIMENRLPVGRATVRGVAITGERYIEFATGIRLKNINEERADEILTRWMWDAFTDYLRKVSSAGVRPKLYWRTKPELITFDANDNFDLKDRTTREPEDMVRRIYMRYLISSLPEQEKYLEPV